MVKSYIVVVLAVALVTSGAITTYLFLGGTRSPENSANISVRIDSPEGNLTIDNAMKLDLERATSVRINVKVLKVEGLQNFSLSGKALLVSRGHEYTIPMPCMASEGVSCFRILSLIPGWDIPLQVAPGEYKVKLQISWSKASGIGDVELHVEIERGASGCMPSLMVVGAEPKGTKGWLIANGSTRTYSMLISKPFVTENECLYRIWIWYFMGKANNTLLIIEDSKGNQVIKVSVPLHSKGIYREALLQVELCKGVTYTVYIPKEDGGMSATLNCS